MLNSTLDCQLGKPTANSVDCANTFWTGWHENWTGSLSVAFIWTKTNQFTANNFANSFLFDQISTLILVRTLFPKSVAWYCTFSIFISWLVQIKWLAFSTSHSNWANMCIFTKWLNLCMKNEKSSAEISNKSFLWWTKRMFAGKHPKFNEKWIRFNLLAP